MTFMKFKDMLGVSAAIEVLLVSMVALEDAEERVVSDKAVVFVPAVFVEGDEETLESDFVAPAVFGALLLMLNAEMLKEVVAEIGRAHV